MLDTRGEDICIGTTKVVEAVGIPCLETTTRKYKNRYFRNTSSIPRNSHQEHNRSCMMARQKGIRGREGADSMTSIKYGSIALSPWVQQQVLVCCNTGAITYDTLAR